MKFQELSQQIQQQAGMCVKCGLCLPQCPTYQLTQNECESPRGRIALMDGLASEKLPLTDKLKTYLDHCLSCSACEVVCPAKVPYGNLLDNGRELIAKKYHAANKIPWLLERGIQQPWILNFIFYLLKFYQLLGLQSLLRKTKLLKLFKLASADALLPQLSKPLNLKSYYPPLTAEQGQVALFIGCINPFLDATTIKSTIKVLTYYGYGVHIPATQRCCGALHLHAGYPDVTDKLQTINEQVFNLPAITAIITIASGCSAVLTEKNFTAPVMDISQFINSAKQPENIAILPLKKRVSLHTPCTLKNVLKNAKAPYELLRKIPDVELLELTSTNCCGAAGLNMLKFPEFSADLLNPLTNQVIQQQTDSLATSNMGCALHFNKALPTSLKITHPITLFSEQLAIKKQ